MDEILYSMDLTFLDPEQQIFKVFRPGTQLQNGILFMFYYRLLHKTKEEMMVAPAETVQIAW